MQPGIAYVVIRGGDDGTLEAGGWLEEVEVDAEWIERRQQKLFAELAALDKGVPTSV